MRHQAFVIEAEAEDGISVAQAWIEKELSMCGKDNPDIIVLRYGLFSVADARRVSELAAGVAFSGESKAVIISASRAYHEAQNALLKAFEEPPSCTYLFLILPSLGGLLPTLHSRVQVMSGFVNPSSDVRLTKPHIPEAAKEFLKATKDKRSTTIKKLATGKDEDERRAHRDDAIAIVNGIEAVARNVGFTKPYIKELLSDISTLRMRLYDRSAPVKMILEHIALVIPKDLL